MLQTFFIWSGVLFWVLIIALFPCIFYSDWKERKKKRKSYKIAMKQLEEPERMPKKHSHESEMKLKQKHEYYE